MRPRIFFVISRLLSLIQILKPDMGECVVFHILHEAICYFNQSKQKRGKCDDEIKPPDSSSRLIVDSVLNRLPLSLDKVTQLNLSEDAQLDPTFQHDRPFLCSEPHYDCLRFVFITSDFFTFPFWKRSFQLVCLSVSDFLLCTARTNRIGIVHAADVFSLHIYKYQG